MKIVIVIPTYNEAENIIKLIDLIYSQAVSRYSLNVLVVDDNSQDGTATLIKNYSKNRDDTFLLERKRKTGIGSAYIAGFEYAIEHLNPDYIVQMDGDHSHNPTDLPSLIDEVLSGYDVVIGSRYVRGGELDNHWPMIRKLNSKLCNFWARSILSLRLVNDCTGGFKIIRASKIKNIKFDTFFSLSYSFQVALIYCLSLQDARIKEIPIYFKNRSLGKSKMRGRDTIELLLHVVRLRLLRKDELVEVI